MELCRIYNENCLDTMARMPDGFIDLIVTDPPYNAINRITNGLRTIDKGTADSLPIDIAALAPEFVRISKGSIYVFCSGEQFTEWTTQFKKLGLSVRNCAWHKSNPSPMNGQSIWLSAMELCVFAKHPKATFNGFCLSPVWNFPVVSEQIHPCQKPSELIATLINISSNENDLIYDPFMGSGTTAKASHQLKRRWIGSEISSEYVELANKRLEPYLAQEQLF